MGKILAQLSIDTGDRHIVKLGLAHKQAVFKHEFAVNFDQAERLLPEIQVFLAKQGLKLADVSEIAVNDEGDSFSALRIGIVTANALAFALDIPVRPLRSKAISRFVAPRYSQAPNITVKKN